MRFAIFGDIHANLHALQAVLADAQEQSCTHHACMGDIVGYNAFPKECLDIIRELDCPVVKGNHDELASLEGPIEGLNTLAELSLKWTRAQLPEKDRQWLRNLRMQRQVRDFTIVHATLDTPQNWAYIMTQLDAAASFSYQHTNLCFVGHTHTPKAYVRDEGVRTEPLDVLSILKKNKYLINVGSVGQSRDGDSRSAYCIFDTDTNEVTLRRVPYDISAAQKGIIEAGLPSKLATRLVTGR